MRQLAVLIPAYKPDERLCALIASLSASGFAHIQVVDDGGGVAYAGIFERCRVLGAAVAVHEVNRGKGQALKTGLEAAARAVPEALGVITADADGQHTAEDIARVGDALADHPDCLILGCRSFSGRVPFRSRFGNAWTRWSYFLVTGRWVTDTQTGLRGIPMGAVGEMLALPGRRYEWEMRMLLTTGLPIREVPIATIYVDDNRGSHFSPLRDGWRVYREIARAVLPGVGAWLASLLSYLLPWPVLPADILSRVLYRLIALRRRGSLPITAGYIALGALGVYGLSLLGVPILPARILTDLAMTVCRRIVRRCRASAVR